MFETSTTRASIGSPSTVMPTRLPVRGEDRERAQPRERVAAAPVVLAAVHELRVDAERDVVQEEPVVRAADVDAALVAVDERFERADRVVAVEPEVAREVVARPERDARERQVALDRHVGDRRERAVAAGHRERARRRRRGRARRGRLRRRGRASSIPVARGRGEQLVGAAVARARVDDQEGLHAQERYLGVDLSRPVLKDGPNRLMRTSGARSIICPWTTAASSIGSRTTSPRRWVEEWAEGGVRAIEDVPRQAPRVPLFLDLDEASA